MRPFIVIDFPAIGIEPENVTHSLAVIAPEEMTTAESRMLLAKLNQSLRKRQQLTILRQPGNIPVKPVQLIILAIGVVIAALSPPDFIARHYPHQRDRSLRDLGAEQARLRPTVWEPQLKYGFFAILAAEMGDTATRDKLLNYADRKYDGVWQEGTYHYPYNPAKGCTNLTDKLIALARALPKDGLFLMHNRIFDPAHFTEPRLAGVDYPTVVLSRALYDREKKALVVSAGPGHDAGGKTSFQIVNLDPARKYQCLVDGRTIQTFSGRTEVDIVLDLDGPHHIVLREQEEG
jgi:hypothetical protein